MAHTPGPWKVIIEHDVINDVPKQWPYAIHADDGELVLGYGEFYQDNETQFANANLMAAAPELLETLKAFVGYYDQAGMPEEMTEEEAYCGFEDLGFSTDECTNVYHARAAIHKAEGDRNG
jgi:hypothetical protein